MLTLGQNLRFDSRQEMFKERRAPLSNTHTIKASSIILLP